MNVVDYMWMWQDKLVHSFLHVDPKEWALAILFSGKCFNQMSHPSSPLPFILNCEGEYEKKKYAYDCICVSQMYLHIITV